MKKSIILSPWYLKKQQANIKKKQVQALFYFDIT